MSDDDYPHCENCLGTGQIITVTEDPVLLRKEKKTVECSKCEGTGETASRPLDPAYNGRVIY